MALEVVMARSISWRAAGVSGLAIAIPALMYGGPASAITTVPGPAAGPAASIRVPKAFKAQSITWISPRRGWVLGAAPCGKSKPCSDVIGTVNGARTWSLLGSVPVPIARSGGPGVSEVRFADRHLGWSFGPGLFATSDGGRSWRASPIPGRGRQVLDLAASGQAVYAVVAPCPVGSVGHCAKPLGLWRATVLHPRRWTRIPVKLPSNFTAEVALHGSTVYVVDPFGPAFGQPDRFYASTNGRTFSTRPDPCRHLLDSALIDVVATSATHVDLLCVGNPGMSRAAKNVYRSVNTARTGTSLGDASSGNQDFGIQSELAASPSGNLAVTSFFER
jgi:hypothetical protein